jgi:hypothetical protein
MNFVHINGNQKEKKQKDLSTIVGSEKDTTIHIIGEDHKDKEEVDEEHDMPTINLTAKPDEDTYLFNIQNVLEKLHREFYEKESPSVIVASFLII